MQTLVNSEKIDSGSNYSFPDKMEYPNIPRSVFNLSHLVSGTMDNAGQIIPLTWFEVLPQDTVEISVRHLIRVMPQVVPLLSRQRIFIHAFAMSYTDLQADFKVLATNGYNGRRTGKKIAPLTETNLDPDIYDSGDGVVTANSLADYLGLPQGATYASLIERGISCLPFLMYESIYKNYYMNKNYYMENQNWLPDDDELFRVNESGELMSNTDDEHDKVTFGKLHYRDYPMDYFTSALPFAQRGDRPTLNLAVEGGDLFQFTTDNLPWVQSLLTTNTGNPQNFYTDHATAVYNSKTIQSDMNSNISNGGLNQVLFVGKHYSASDPIQAEGSLSKAAAMSANELFNTAIQGVVKTSVGVDNLREMMRQQVELEKMARTDGSFDGFIKTFFGIDPKVPDCRPILFGSSYSQLSFTEVLQTSQSSASSALGEIAGHGISVENNGYLGKYHSNNYGMIMIVATIMPDVYYHQGLEKKWTRRSQAELYLPERAKMGLQPIKNEEIYFTGDTSSDNDLFGYQNPFDDLRYMQNRICGKVADMEALSFAPFTQARTFESQPTLSQSFAVADDVRKDYLFAPIENAYLFQFAFDVRAVRPLPYKAIPNNFGF